MSVSFATIRVNGDVREGAARIAERFGFDPSSVTRAFYRRTIRESCTTGRERIGAALA